jgi:hypothetical protein
MVAPGDVGQSSFQLLRVDFSNASSPYTPVGPTRPGLLLVQGDATAYAANIPGFKASNSTFFAVLNAAPAGTVDYSNSSLYAFDARTGAVLFTVPFPANYTMGALAWEPALSRIVGLCGALLVNLTVEGYCAVDPLNPGGGYSFIANWNWTLSYDPDTRTIDPVKHRYYHRLYNNTWMPDYFVTLNSETGALLQYAQFFSPEFSGTRALLNPSGPGTAAEIFSICNADAGLDLCVVDPASGSFTPLNVFDRLHESDELFAATAVVDSKNKLYILNVDLAVDGFHTRVVDIDRASPTYATIVANISVPSAWFPSNYHVLQEADDVEAAGGACNATLDPASFERDGGDFVALPGVPGVNDTLEDCIAACCASAGCRSFSYNNPQPMPVCLPKEGPCCAQGGVCCMLKSTRPPLTNNTFGPAVRTGTLPAPAPVPPFPASTFFTSVSFGPVSYWEKGQGDTWPTMWAADGSVCEWKKKWEEECGEKCGERENREPRGTVLMREVSGDPRRVALDPRRTPILTHDRRENREPRGTPSFPSNERPSTSPRRLPLTLSILSLFSPLFSFSLMQTAGRATSPTPARASP